MGNAICCRSYDVVETRKKRVINHPDGSVETLTEVTNKKASGAPCSNNKINVEEIDPSF